MEKKKERKVIYIRGKAWKDTTFFLQLYIQGPD